MERRITQERIETILAASSVVFSLLLLVTLKLFLDNPHHRIAGVAWTGLIQLLAPFSFLYSMLILVGLMFGGIKHCFGFHTSIKTGTAIKMGFAGLILGLSSIACLTYSMPILLSI